MSPLALSLLLAAPAHGPHHRDKGFPPLPPAIVVQAPPAVLVPPPPPVVVDYAPARLLTHQEFAKVFQPTPGHHRVVLQHPKTCRPVEVCFNLPHGCGCPKVNVGKRHVEWDFGKREVKIEFKSNGTVDVDYDD